MRPNAKAAIIKILKSHPDGATYSMLWRETGHCRPTLRRHLLAMEASGEVERMTPKNRRHRDKFKMVEHLSQRRMS